MKISRSIFLTIVNNFLSWVVCKSSKDSILRMLYCKTFLHWNQVMQCWKKPGRLCQVCCLRCKLYHSLLALIKTYQNIDNKRRRLPSFELPGDIYTSDEIDVLWHKLYTCDGGGHAILHLKNLSKFVSDLMSLPHSKAECERIFRAVNLTKTKIVFYSNHQLNRITKNILYGEIAEKGNVGSSGETETEDNEDVSMPSYH